MNEFYDMSSTEDILFLPISEDTQDPSCWVCKMDTRNLICPCKCENKFIHAHCLELLANTRNIFHCPYCHVAYPLEIQRKSFLKMLLKACVPFVMILFSIFSNFMIGLVLYILLSVDSNLLITTIMKIIMSATFFWFICMTVRKIIGWVKRIYQYYYQWHNGWKLIKEYNIQNIEDD